MDGWAYKQAWIHRTRIFERIHVYGLFCTNSETITITFKKNEKKHPSKEYDKHCWGLFRAYYRLLLGVIIACKTVNFSKKSKLTLFWQVSSTFVFILQQNCSLSFWIISVYYQKGVKWPIFSKRDFPLKNSINFILVGLQYPIIIHNFQKKNMWQILFLTQNCGKIAHSLIKNTLWKFHILYFCLIMVPFVHGKYYKTYYIL